MEIQEVEELFRKVMQHGIKQLDLSVSAIEKLTQEITNPNKNLRMVRT